MNKLIAFTSFVLFFGCIRRPSDDLQALVGHMESQIDYAIKSIRPIRTECLAFPRTVENGGVKLVSRQDWTSGFFPGNLWMMYELSGNNRWRKEALQYTLLIEPEKWNGTTHDLGFKMYSSFGKALKYTNNPAFREILIQSARTLSTRFSPIVGCIQSWDHNTNEWKFPVNINNMMNLELLLWAAKETGNDNFKVVAIQHAKTTAKHHFRSDNSTYQLIDFDPETGEVENRLAYQGYSPESCWARGQAWALYGFTVMYRETGIAEFLTQAEKIAQYIMAQPGISEGEIPYWDFNAPDIPNEPYDASAGAIISAALFELSEFSGSNQEAYFKVAERLLTTLSTPEFLAAVGENRGFLLKHSTGSKPHQSEVDVPIVYADYYFLESIIKYKNMQQPNR